MDASKEYSPGFETQVLVNFTDIKGALQLIDQKVDTQAEKTKEHDADIKALKEQVARNKGRDAILSFLVPIALSFTVALLTTIIKGTL